MKSEFKCGVCGKKAGTIELISREKGWVLRTESFVTPYELLLGAEPSDFVTKAVQTGSARSLDPIDAELLPFYCPIFDQSYCEEHWRTWRKFDPDGWYDSLRGACPNNHSRMLED